MPTSLQLLKDDSHAMDIFCFGGYKVGVSGIDPKSKFNRTNIPICTPDIIGLYR
jgi:hypothetical protein